MHQKIYNLIIIKHRVRHVHSTYIRIAMYHNICILLAHYAIINLNIKLQYYMMVERVWSNTVYDSRSNLKKLIFFHI